MDIRPADACNYCEKDNWSITIVDTSDKIDLFTGNKSLNYTGASTCLDCGMVTFWKVEPDKPYPPSNQNRNGTAK